MSITDQKWRLNNLYRIIDRHSNSIPFQLNPVQEDVLDNIHTRNLILKARQLGMSTFAVIFLLDCVLFSENLGAGIVSYSLEHAQHIFKRIIGHALDTLPQELKSFAGIVQRSAREITFNNGSSLRVDTTLRGGSYPLVLVSEFGKTCARNPQKAEEVITGTLQAVPRDGKVIIESTAEGNEGFFAEMVMEANRRGNDNLSNLNYKLFFYNWLEEPTYMINESVNYDVTLTDYFNKIEKEIGRQITQSQRNWYAVQSSILGDKIKQEFPSTVSEAFLSSSDAFYFAEAINEAYSSNRCLYTPLYDALSPVYVAMDIGVNDLTVMGFFQVVHGEVRIIDYYENKNKGVDFYAQFLLQDKKLLYNTIFLPHDSTKRDALDVSNTYERDFRRLFSGTSTRFHVLPRMDKQLSISHAKIMLNRCVFNVSRVKPLLDQMAKYRKTWNESQGRYLEEPFHNEACFIGETLIETNKGEIRIDQIKKGDLVRTPNGFKKVVNVFQYSSKKLISIYSKERFITCTPHHEIFTMKGLVKADSLRYNDRIITTKDKELCHKLLSLGVGKNVGFKEYFLSIPQERLFTLMDINIEKINLDTGLEDQLAQRKGMGVCIGLYGHIIKEKFLIKCIYTIKTAINRIMKLKILNSLNQKNTLLDITRMKKDNDLDSTLINAEIRPKLGIAQKKVLNGIKNMVNMFSIRKIKLISFVLNVKNLSSQSGLKLCFAPLIAVPHQEDYRVLMMNQGNALIVKNHSNATDMPIKGHVQKIVPIRLESSQKVYDIEVEGDHCYFANGFLVSNSNYADCFRYISQAVGHIETVSNMGGALEKHRKAVESRYRQVY